MSRHEEDNNNDNYTYPWNAGKPPYARDGCLLFRAEVVRYRDSYARYLIRSHRAGRHESQPYLLRTSRQKRLAQVHARFPRIQGVPSPNTNVRYKRWKCADPLRPGKAILGQLRRPFGPIRSKITSRQGSMPPPPMDRLLSLIINL